jgi:CRISPR-associated endoribonuclease Cas6
MQNILFPKFALYRLRLLLELGARRQTLPAYLGSTVRGIFAASFRQVVCVTRAPVCDGCLLLHRCPYPYIFETPPALSLPEALQKRFRQAPRPYIFEVPLIYRGEETLELGLVLVGRALDFLPYFLYVVQETGKSGLGRARVPYRLLTVTDGSRADGSVIFQAEAGIVRDNVQAITLADVQHPGDNEVQQVTLELLTPLRVKKYGDYQSSGERLEFVTLIDLLLGRVEALSLFHCGDAWAPNTALREAARSVQVVAKHLALQRLERYSNRHHQKLPLHGVVGTLSFAGNLTPFLSLLRLGAHLHIGAGTAFGLGHYRLSTAG